MSEGNNAVQSIKYHGRIDHLVVVQFPQIFYLGYPALVKFKVILFQTQSDLLEDIVNDHDDKVLVVAVQRSKKDSKQMDIAVLHFPGFGKYFLHDANDLSELIQSTLRSKLNSHILFLPMQLAN